MKDVQEYACPVMLTIAETSKRSGLSYDFIRRLCLEDKIVFIKAGSKYLVNWDKFVNYLNGELQK